MQKLKLATLILSVGIMISSCQSQTKEQQITQKEKELLQRENDLLKKELGKSDSTIQNPTTTETFLVDKKLVKKMFLQYLPNISDGRKLGDYTVVLGDLNGDNLIDGIVDYGLEPTYEDNGGGGGNAIGEIPGLVAFTNTGNKLVIADHSEEFGANKELRNITDGVIFLEGLDYSEDDARCCPSLKTTTKLVLRNNKLTQLK